MRLIRWRLKLEEYDYEIICKKGKVNANVDALSKYPVEQALFIEDASETENTEKENEKKEYTEEEKNYYMSTTTLVDAVWSENGTNHKKNPITAQLAKFKTKRANIEQCRSC